MEGWEYLLSVLTREGVAETVEQMRIEECFDTSTYHTIVEDLLGPLLPHIQDNSIPPHHTHSAP